MVCRNYTFYYVCFLFGGFYCYFTIGRNRNFSFSAITCNCYSLRYIKYLLNNSSVMTMHHNFIAIHALAKFIIYSSFLSLSSVIVVFLFYFLPILIYFLTIPIFNPPFIDIYLSLKVCIFEK